MQLLNDTLSIATRIPNDAPCYVEVNDQHLDPQSAIRIGEEIVAAGRRAIVLNQLLALLLEQGSEHQPSVELLRVYLTRLRTLK